LWDRNRGESKWTWAHRKRGQDYRNLKVLEPHKPTFHQQSIPRAANLQDQNLNKKVKSGFLQLEIEYELTSQSTNSLWHSATRFRERTSRGRVFFPFVINSVPINSRRRERLLPVFNISKCKHVRKDVPRSKFRVIAIFGDETESKPA
jgi:hypothetical protein